MANGVPGCPLLPLPVSVAEPPWTTKNVGAAEVGHDAGEEFTCVNIITIIGELVIMLHGVRREVA